jgi:hypothetical protein
MINLPFWSTLTLEFNAFWPIANHDYTIRAPPLTSTDAGCHA